MSTLGRLKKIQASYEMNKELYPQIPDFDSWSEDQLIRYNTKWINDFIIENKITCFNDAETLLKKWLSKNLINEADYNLFIEALKEYWFNGASA